MCSPPPLGLTKWALMEEALLCWWASNGDGGSTTARFSLSLWDSTELDLCSGTSFGAGFVWSGIGHSVWFFLLGHELFIFMTYRVKSSKSSAITSFHFMTISMTTGHPKLPSCSVFVHTAPMVTTKWTNSQYIIISHHSYTMLPVKVGQVSLPHEIRWGMHREVLMESGVNGTMSWFCSCSFSSSLAALMCSSVPCHFLTSLLVLIFAMSILYIALWSLSIFSWGHTTNRPIIQNKRNTFLEILVC